MLPLLLLLTPLALGVAGAQVVEDTIEDDEDDVSALGTLPPGVGVGSYDIVRASIQDEPDAKVVVIEFAEPPVVFQQFIEQGTVPPTVLILAFNLDGDPEKELEIGVMGSFMTYTGTHEYSLALFENLNPGQTILSVEGNKLAIRLEKDKLGPLAQKSWSFRGLSSETPAIQLVDATAMLEEIVPSPSPGEASPTTTETPPAQTTTTTTTQEESPLPHPEDPEVPEVGVGEESLLEAFEDPEGDVEMVGLAGGGIEDQDVNLESMDLRRMELYSTGDALILVIETHASVDPRFFDPQTTRDPLTYFNVEVVVAYETQTGVQGRLVLSRGLVADEASGTTRDGLQQGLVRWGGNRIVVEFPLNLIPPGAGELAEVYIVRGETKLAFVNGSALISLVDDLNNAQKTYTKEEATSTVAQPTYTITLPVETSGPPGMCVSYEPRIMDAPPLRTIVFSSPAAGDSEVYSIMNDTLMELTLDLSRGYTEIMLSLSPEYDTAGDPANVRAVLQASFMGQELQLESTPFGQDGTASISLLSLPPMGYMPSIRLDARITIYNDNDCTQTEMPLTLSIQSSGPGPVYTSPPSPGGPMEDEDWPPMGEPTLPGMMVNAKVERADIYTYIEEGTSMIAYLVDLRLESEGAWDYELFTISKYKDGSVEESSLGSLRELLSFARQTGEGVWTLDMNTPQGLFTIVVKQEKPGDLSKLGITMRVEAPLTPGTKPPKELDSVDLRIVAFADQQKTQWNHVIVPIPYKIHEGRPPSSMMPTPSPTTPSQPSSPSKPGGEASTTTSPTTSTDTTEEGGMGAATVLAMMAVVALAGAALAFMRRGG